jgi:hypothetical protein
MSWRTSRSDDAMQPHSAGCISTHYIYCEFRLYLGILTNCINRPYNSQVIFDKRRRPLSYLNGKDRAGRLLSDRFNRWPEKTLSRTHNTKNSIVNWPFRCATAS